MSDQANPQGIARPEIRFPNVEVDLSCRDGNAFAILGAVQRELRKAGVEEAIIDEYLDEARSGDYNNLLAVTMRWVEVR